MAPDFLITIDTEADNEWDLTAERSFANIARLRELQDLCDRHGVKPTYLVAYDVIQDGPSRELLQQLAAEGNCEIGAHLHAWSTPPDHELMPGIFRHNPYLHEFPPHVQEEKLGNLTRALADAFGRQPLSYRGGRWSFDALAGALLVEAGYLVDTTVTPGVSWQVNPGYSPGAVGPNYSGTPRVPFRFEAAEFGLSEGDGLVEVPVSIIPRGSLKHLAEHRSGRANVLSPLAALGRRALHKTGLCRLVWLRPGFSSAADMAWACDELCRQNAPVLNLMFHSSELLAGGSPRIQTEADARQFIDDLDHLLAYVTRNLGVRGLTLQEFAREWQEAAQPVAVAHAD